MKIAITGAQGVGKTVFAELLAKYLPDHELLPEAARLAAEAGFELDKEATIDSEICIMGKQVEMEHRSDKWIADRCFIDIWAYVRTLFNEQSILSNIIAGMTLYHAKQYDYIFYIPIEDFPIKDDGLRLVDKDAQINYDKHIQDILSILPGNKRIIKLTGSVQDRVDQALEAMYLNKNQLA